MNRLYALKNLVNYSQSTKSFITRINVFSISYCHANLLQKNRYFTSNFFDHLEEEIFEE